MDEHKTPKEEYSFMQEVIKDETDSPKKIRNKILRFIGYGVLLGGAASVTFTAFQPWFHSHFNNNPSQVEIPKDEEEDQPEEETVKEEKAVPDSDDYQQVLQTLNTKATEAKKSMTSVTCLLGGKKDTAMEKKSVAGVIIADNGKELLILAQFLEVGQTDTLQVTFSDGKTCSATEKMGDYNSGLCIYAVGRDQIDDTTWAAIRTVDIGNSNSVGNGEPVIAVGQPFGSDLAFSYGMVSADEEYAQLADGDYRLLCTNISGNTKEGGSGILLNRYGQMIGLIDQSVLGEGSSGRIGGYAISDIKTIIELLSNNSPVPYTGIYGMDVTEELMQKGGMPQGVYVKEVAVDSPAMAAGIQSGDVIVSADGNDIVSLDNYHAILMQKKEGSEISLKGCRQGAKGEYVDIDFKVKVGSRNKD